MTKDEIILGQAEMLAELKKQYEILKISHGELRSLEQKESEALDAYVEKYGNKLKDEIMSVPF